MLHSSRHALVAILAAFLGGVAGFVAGRLSSTSEAGTPTLQANPNTGALSIEEANAKVLELERERDQLRQGISGMTNNDRVAVASVAAASEAVAPDGMIGATTADSDEKGAVNPTEVMDAATTLVALKAAIANGDAEAVASLRPSVLANDQALTRDLVAMLDTADSLFATEQLANLLGELGDPAALPALQTLLESASDDAVRTAVVRALGRIPDQSSVKLLTAEFARESGSPMPPSLAATSLGQIGTPGAIESLKREIESGDNGMVRSFAMTALAARKDPELVPFFFAQVRREGASERGRKQAIEAIAGTGARTAIPELESVAFSTGNSRSIQEAAKRAINQILGETRYQVR